MPFSVRWRGRSIYRPGVYTYNNLDGLKNLDLGTDAAIVIIGEADAGQPQATAATPVYHVFTDARGMTDTFITGNLAECARPAFTPAKDGQHENGVPIKGCDTVYAIKTNQSTQASYSVEDASANAAFTLKDRIWGAKGNQTWFTITVSGTGLELAMGRVVAPNVGTQTATQLFSITGTDEWISFATAAGYTGVSCAVTFDGTTLTFNSSVANEDLAITCTAKTMETIVAEINAFKGVVPGVNPIYEAVILRNNRSTVLATYLDRIGGAGLDIHAGLKSAMGVSYDMVTWINANSVYGEATWVGGYEPKVYTTTYLAGGALGNSTSTTVEEALKTARKIGCRFAVMAVDADIGAGGAVTVAAVNALFKTHLNNCNPIGGRAERQGFCCTDSTTKAALYSEVSTLNNEWLFAVNHKLRMEDPEGTIAWLGCHTTATAAAAICAGSPIATPLTFKVLNCYDFAPVATDFDPDVDLDYNNAIENGLLMLESSDGEVRFAKGITTYTTEDNDGRTYGEVVEARLWMHRVLRRALEKPFTGSKGKGNRTAHAVRGVVMDTFRQLADPNSPDFILIEGTDETTGAVVPAYRNVTTTVSGDQVYVYAEVTYTMGINFIFNSLVATLPTSLAA